VGSGLAEVLAHQFVGRHAEAETLVLEDLLDLGQRRLAEVLVAEQLGLGLLDEVAERLDVHLREAVAAAHRQLEVVDRGAQELVALVVAALLVLVVVHVQRGGGVAAIQARPRVVRVRLQGEVEALHGAAVVAHVLVEDAEVDDARDVDGRRHQRALVELARFFVLAAQVDVHREAEQRLLVVGIEAEHVVVAGDCAFGLVAQFAHAAGRSTCGRLR
jgi:hypothetical protein